MGYTQARVADEIGTSLNTISRWETGRQVPAMAWLPSISAAYGVPAEELSVYLGGAVLGSGPGSVSGPAPVSWDTFRSALADSLSGLLRGTESSLEEALLGRGFPVDGKSLQPESHSWVEDLFAGAGSRLSGPFPDARPVNVLQVAAAAGSGAADVDETPVGIHWFDRGASSGISGLTRTAVMSCR